MNTVDEATQSMIRNLHEKTGKSLAEWIAIARASPHRKVKEMIGYLKEEHGLTYGYANLIALKANESDAASIGSEAELVEAQYAGPKAALRPLYDRLIAAITAFGPDVEIAPKKAYVSVRRAKQFAIIQPSTPGRLDLGLNLKGVPAGGRLEPSGSFNSMVSHRVRLASLDEVNAEVAGWLRQAYDAA